MWFYLGIIIGTGLVLLVLWLRERGVKIPWYNWLMAIVGLALLSFGIQNYSTSSASYEPNAPRTFLVVFGVPGLLLLVLAGVILWLNYARKRRSGQSAVS